MIATAAELGAEIDLIVLTDGEHCHPDSTTTSSLAMAMAKIRREEPRRAIRTLAPGVTLRHWGLGDGRLADQDA